MQRGAEKHRGDGLATFDAIRSASPREVAAAAHNQPRKE